MKTLLFPSKTKISPQLEGSSTSGKYNLNLLFFIVFVKTDFHNSELNEHNINFISSSRLGRRSNVKVSVGFFISSSNVLCSFVFVPSIKVSVFLYKSTSPFSLRSAPISLHNCFLQKRIENEMRLKSC